LTIVSLAIIVLVTVPESPVVTTVPVVAGKVIVVDPATALGCNVIVPDVDPGSATEVIPAKAKLALALFNATLVVPIYVVSVLKATVSLVVSGVKYNLVPSNSIEP